MTEEEALIRAREAVKAARIEAGYNRDSGWLSAVDKGEDDGSVAVLAAKRALLDLDNPLPVDRDLEDLREMLASIEDADSGLVMPTSRELRDGEYDARLQKVVSTFQRIIQRRIEESKA